MATFGQDFLNGFKSALLGTQSGDLKDYRHASIIYTSDYYSNSPKTKFSYHVSFNLNKRIPGLQKLFANNSENVLSYSLKSAQLPQFQFSVDEMNQYNRKRYIQTKIQYQPVTLSLHDDNADNVRQMWYAYYSYYYRDPAYSYRNTDSGNPNQGSGFTYNATDIYARDREANDFGFIGESSFPVSFGEDPGVSSKIPFFNDITIYSFNQHSYSAYTLVNPIITFFGHDQHDYSQGNGTMTNTMTINYELVKYYGGAISASKQNVPGFAATGAYDFLPSSISEGRTNTILGQGGLLDAATGVFVDLESGNYIGAAVGALRTAETFKNVNIRRQLEADIRRAARQVGTGLAVGTVRAAIPFINGRVPVYPTPPSGQAVNRIIGTQKQA